MIREDYDPKSLIMPAHTMLYISAIANCVVCGESDMILRILAPEVLMNTVEDAHLSYSAQGSKESRPTWLFKNEDRVSFRLY